MQVLHLKLFNEPVVLVATHFPIEENTYHGMGIWFIFVLASVNHMQLQVKLVPANCVLRGRMNMKLFNLEVAHLIIVV